MLVGDVEKDISAAMGKSIWAGFSLSMDTEYVAVLIHILYTHMYFSIPPSSLNTHVVTVQYNYVHVISRNKLLTTSY